MEEGKQVSEVAERLLYVIKNVYEYRSLREFAQALGMNRADKYNRLARGEREPDASIMLEVLNFDFANRSALGFPRVNGHWILTGEGSIYLEPDGDKRKLAAELRRQAEQLEQQAQELEQK